MGNVKRRNVPKQSGEWGVVETRSNQGFGHHTEVWLAYWMELGKPGRVSIEVDPDRAANIAPAPWGRARRAFGVPLRILVLDDETAARVRRVVPSRVAVVVAADDPRLVELAACCDDDFTDDDLDMVPFPAPRARC
jgi:hypothetical protein